MRAALLLLMLALAFATSAWGGSSARSPAQKRSEALQQVRQILSNAALGSSVARLRFLGEEAYAVKALARALEDGLDESQRRSVATAFAMLEHRSAEGHLLAFTEDEDPAVRMAAAEGLGRIQSKKTERLVPLLEDASFGVRREAARALERCGAKGHGGALLQAASVEGEPEIRVAMISAAGTSGERALIPALEPFRESSSEATRFAATRALCRLGSADALAAARALLSSEDPAERLRATALLEGVALASTRELLTPSLDDAEPRVAAAAARSLHLSGDRRMVAWLVLRSDLSEGETKLIYERELERLRVSDEERRRILRQAGRR